MAYIVVLNPIILTSAPVVNGYKPGFLTVACVTALIAGLMTIVMGVVGKYPFAMAAGLGINAVVAFQLAPVIGYAGAMGVVVLEGIVTTILVLTGIRRKMMESIPDALKLAIGAGIGLFLAFIGLVDGGIIRGNAGSPPVGLGQGGSLFSWPQLVFVVTLAVTAILWLKKKPGAIIIGILVGTVLAFAVEAFAHLGAASAKNPGGWMLNVPSFAGKKVLVSPDFSVMGHFSLSGAFGAGAVLGVLFVFSLMLADFFDTMGTVVAVGSEGKLLDKDRNLPGVGRVLGVDSVSAAVGGLAGVSSNTTYVESSAGVAEGARTGLASVVTGLLFLVAVVLTPLTQVVPSEAAAPVLVVVGYLMIVQVLDIPWREAEVAIPAFLGMIIMPLTYSITNGIGAAFVFYAVLMTAKGRAREVTPLLWLTAVLFVVYFAFVPIKSALGLG